MPELLSQCPLNTPSAIKPRSYGSSSDMKSTLPLPNRQRFPFMCNFSIKPSIVHLINWERPVAIARGVMSIIIGSLDRVPAGRFIPHIIDKVDIGGPSVANGNTSSAIPIKASILFGKTSLSHVSPSLKFSSIRFPMCCRFVSSKLFTETPARSGGSFFKVSSPTCSSVPAVTGARPHRIPVFGWGSLISLNNNKSPKFLVYYVHSFSHFRSVA